MQYFNLSAHSHIIQQHYDLLEEYLQNQINVTTLNAQVKKYIEDNLKDIITGEPLTLDKLNSDLKSLHKYRSSIKNKIAKIFNYTYFSTKSDTRYDAYDLTAKLNIRTCMYCNRNYTLTVMTGRLKSEKYTRPELDHFFDKGENPLLALSIFNLIPSCKTCNSSLKGKSKFSLKSHLHPYGDDVVKKYHYKFKPYDVATILGTKANLKLEIKVGTGINSLDRKINTSKSLFRLEEIMSAHSEELKDLFDLKYRFSERYFEELFKTYSALGLNQEEVYRIVFGVYYTEDNFTKRPFSKLKKDILIELNIIK